MELDGESVRDGIRRLQDFLDVHRGDLEGDLEGIPGEDDPLALIALSCGLDGSLYTEAAALTAGLVCEQGDLPISALLEATGWAFIGLLAGLAIAQSASER